MRSLGERGKPAGENRSTFGLLIALVRSMTLLSRFRSGNHSGGNRAAVILRAVKLNCGFGRLGIVLRGFKSDREGFLELLGIFLQKVLCSCV